MGYFETKERILVGDQQADIIDNEIKNMSFEEVRKLGSTVKRYH